MIDRLISACRVPPELSSGVRGLWRVKRWSVAAITDSIMLAEVSRRLGGCLDWTALHRTDHKPRPWGEVVMEDSPVEIRKHLPILLAARGRVLVTGLGLGCVVRGLLSKPEVDHVDVVELDPDVIKLTGGEFLQDHRVTIRQGDALTINWETGSRWDYAWHDVWTEPGQEALPLLHARLLMRYDTMCIAQGAWELPRYMKRIWPKRLLGRAA